MKGIKYDENKPDMTLVPIDLKIGVARVLEHGAKKYGRENWKHVQDAKRRYLAALMRHADALANGEEVDPESGEPHAAHIATGAGFLLYFMKQGK